MYNQFLSLCITIGSLLLGLSSFEAIAAVSNPERGTISVKVKELKNGSLTAIVIGKQRKVDVQAAYEVTLVFTSPNETVQKSCTLSANTPLVEEFNPGIESFVCALNPEKAIVTVTYQRYNQPPNGRLQGDIEIKRNSQLVMTAKAEGLLVLFDDTNPIFDPVILNVNGPLLTPRTNLISTGTEFCATLGTLLEGVCLDYVNDVANLLVGYDLSGSGTPNALLTLFVSPNCAPEREWRQVLANDIQAQVSAPLGLDSVLSIFIDQIINSLGDLADLTIDVDGNFVVRLVLASQDELRATVKGPMFRPCSNSIDLPSL